MLTMLGSPRRCCDGITRRETFKTGSLSALGGFGLPQMLGGATTQPQAGGSRRSTGRVQADRDLRLCSGVLSTLTLIAVVF